jgi:heterodisulfide reductase subunit B
MDDPENPTILEDLLQALGCDVVEFPHKVECCGSYVGISAPDVARQVSGEILQMAADMGAETMALACPLCAYNLGELPSNGVSVLYFTEILAKAVEGGS